MTIVARPPLPPLHGLEQFAERAVSYLFRWTPRGIESWCFVASLPCATVVLPEPFLVAVSHPSNGAAVPTSAAARNVRCERTNPGMRSPRRSVLPVPDDWDAAHVAVVNSRCNTI